VSVAHAFGPADDVARTNLRFAFILDEDGTAGKHHQELVLALMPMALARPGARLKDDVARAKLGQARRLRQAALPASGDGLVERRRIAGPVARLERIKVDLGHACRISRSAAAARRCLSRRN